MKCYSPILTRQRVTSLPVRGAWVEIDKQPLLDLRATSLPVRGAWVEIERHRHIFRPDAGRSPCGERGLKWLQRDYHGALDIVAPRAGSVG